jgi:ribosomal protein S18 acetylase RimI-like enzyme
LPGSTLPGSTGGDGATGTHIGYLWIIVEPYKQACFIAQIYLHPEHRRQGWGRATLTLLEQRMRQQGIRRISLHVFAENSPAQDLYRSLGYIVTDINMQKLLPD